MRPQTHILNGDALKDQLANWIKGNILVARECLVDGSVKGDNLSAFYQTRAQFLSQNYQGISVEDYYKDTVPQFEKILTIAPEADVNLWFEDDLFCQVNFWFVLNLLVTFKKTNSIYLIRPKTLTSYGFSGLSQMELLSVYKNKIRLTDVEKLAGLWDFYKNDQTDKLLKTAKELENKYPFIVPAVEAHIQRIPDKLNPGRPVQSLIQIMKDLETNEFGPVFKEFNKREYIYGFGDLQVKRLYNTILNKS